MLHTWDSQGRTLLGKEYCMPCNIKQGDNVVFQRVEDKKFRILLEERAKGEILARTETKIDVKYRFIIPTVIRKKYKNDFDLTFCKEEECFYISFSEFVKNK